MCHDANNDNQESITLWALNDTNLWWSHQWLHHRSEVERQPPCHPEMEQSRMTLFKDLPTTSIMQLAHTDNHYCILVYRQQHIHRHTGKVTLSASHVRLSCYNSQSVMRAWSWNWNPECDSGKSEPEQNQCGSLFCAGLMEWLYFA